MSKTLRTRRSQLDETSKLIVEELQHDGRKSYAEIGKVVGLSEAAVRQRVQKLTEAKVMQIVAVTDPLVLGFSRQAMIGIKCSGDALIVAKSLAEIATVDYARSYFRGKFCLPETRKAALQLGNSMTSFSPTKKQ